MIIPNIQIGVIGDSECTEAELNLAYEIGYEIGKDKAILICGGRGGIMEKAAHGCKDTGGLVVGILPSMSRLEGNKFLDVQIPTGLGWTRNSLVALSSDVLIIIGGRSGTLSEIAYGWMYDKPIVALNHPSIRESAWGRQLAGKALDERRNDVIVDVKTPKEAVEIAITLARENMSKNQKEILSKG
ncbi:MAG: TIGR00725 family protein [Candidatus Hodarchaeales archaeon]|jgi:uncharacterized protein (TIGR00725 family)